MAITGTISKPRHFLLPTLILSLYCLPSGHTPLHHPEYSSRRLSSEHIHGLSSFPSDLLTLLSESSVSTRNFQFFMYVLHYDFVLIMDLCPRAIFDLM